MADQPLPAVQIASPAGGAKTPTASPTAGSGGGSGKSSSTQQANGQDANGFSELLNGRLSKKSPQAIARAVRELKAKLSGGQGGRPSKAASGGKDLPADQLLAALLASLTGAAVPAQVQSHGGNGSPSRGSSSIDGHSAASLTPSQELALLAQQLGLTAAGVAGGKVGAATAGDAGSGVQHQLPAALAKLLHAAEDGGKGQSAVAQAVHAALAGAQDGADSTKHSTLSPRLLAALQQAVSHPPGVVHAAASHGPAHGSADPSGALSHAGDVGAAPPVQVPAAPAQATANIHTSIHQPGWDQALGERVKWMVGQNIQDAQLRLTPAHLGPINVHVSVHNGQASINFSAHHVVTREHLEAAIPRLREMLGNTGLNLASVNVSQHPFGGNGGQNPGAFAHSRNRAGNEPDLVVEEPVSDTLRSAARVALGAIDYFA